MSDKVGSWLANLKKALETYYWKRIKANESPENPYFNKPLDDLAEYILKAWKSRLDKREECAYAGTKLLQSVLDRTGRKYVEDVKEANELFVAGMQLASYLWGLLDRYGDGDAFNEEMNKIKKFLKNRIKY